jgi:anti-sigma factor RsiW
MNQHLSQDEKARWLVGQSRPEEEAHVRSCPTCTAELMEFRAAVSTFQGAMKTWSQQETFPRLVGADRSLWRALPQLPAPAWALIMAMAAGMFLLPAVWSPRVAPPPVEPAPETKTNNDILLMEAVAAHLARPLPSPMERVLVLFPEQDASSEVKEREEAR